MNKYLLTFMSATLALSRLGLAQVADPVADFKTGLNIPSQDKILRWTFDINGDGKNEVFLSLKSDRDKIVQEHEPPSWACYVADASGATYSKMNGVELEPLTIASILPDIDVEACYVGQIAELGKRGIVTVRVDNPRSGPPVAKIYAYTIEGDHLKRTELAQYDPTQTPHALFTKYLADDKRTHVQLQEIAP